MSTCKRPGNNKESIATAPRQQQQRVASLVTRGEIHSKKADSPNKKLFGHLLIEEVHVTMWVRSRLWYFLSPVDGASVHEAHCQQASTAVREAHCL